MKLFLILKLFILLIIPAKSAFSMTPMEVAFMDFFNTKKYGALSKRSNVSVVHSGGVVADLGMKIDIEFNVKGVEKVLILKIPDSGYDNYGLLNKSCRDEPVKIAGYNFNPVENISKLSLLMKSQCGQSLIRLVVWARTMKGEYYRGYIAFKANTSSNTENS